MIDLFQQPFSGCVVCSAVVAMCVARNRSPPPPSSRRPNMSIFHVPTSDLAAIADMRRPVCFVTSLRHPTSRPRARLSYFRMAPNGRRRDAMFASIGARK
jgi:hypothetical protein